MAENNSGVSAEVLKRTKTTLGAIITKPPLTDKLLQRPPFKYLHDIITEVMKTTGYFKGLFTADELDHSKITNKEQKVAFLQKVIDVVIMASGESLKVRPSKVVSGHEAERTNELLQTLSLLITNKVDCSDAVQKVLKGEKPPEKEKRKRPPAVAEQSKSKPPDKAKHHTSSTSKPTDKKEKQAASSSAASSSTNVTGGTSSQKDDQKVDTVRSRPKAADKDGRKDPLESSALSVKSTNSLQASSSKDSRHKEHKSRSNRKEKHRGSKEEEQTKSSSTAEVKEPLVNGEVHENEQPPDLERPPPARGKRKSHHSDSKEPAHPIEASVNEEEAAHSNNDQGASNIPTDDQAVKEPEQPNSPPLPPMNMFPQGGRRPGSARPAPPKIVRHTEEEPQDVRVTSGSAKLNVILDNNKDDDNEEEKFFVEDPTTLPEDPIVNGELADAKPEGALTKKMMLNKELLQGELPTDASSTEQPRISEAQRKKEREMVAKEIEQLQSSIQGLCRSAMPLGRVMDYVQEDMDSMLKELELWQKESSQHKEALQREQR